MTAFDSRSAREHRSHNKEVRLPITAVVRATTWVQFHVDLLGSDLTIIGQPDNVPPLVRGVIPDVRQRGYRAYPLVDHVADEVATTLASRP